MDVLGGLAGAHAATPSENFGQGFLLLTFALRDARQAEGGDEWELVVQESGARIRSEGEELNPLVDVTLALAHALADLQRGVAVEVDEALVTLGLFQRMEIIALEIFDDLDLDIAARLSSRFGGRDETDQDGLEHAVLAHTGGQLRGLHRVEMTARVACARDDVFDGQVLEVHGCGRVLGLDDRVLGEASPTPELGDSDVGALRG